MYGPCMDDLENITSRLAIIASERSSLDSEESELLVAQRVLRRLRGKPVAIEASPPASPARVITGDIFALKGQQAQALKVLPVDGTPISRADFKREMDSQRSEPMSDNAFITMLSRLAAAKLIERDAETVRRYVGGADVS